MAVVSTLLTVSVNVSALASVASATEEATVAAAMVVTVLDKATAATAKMTIAMAGEARAMVAMEDVLLVASAASEVDSVADSPAAALEAMAEATMTATVVVMVVVMVVGMEVASAGEAAKDAEGIPCIECVHHKSNLGTNFHCRANQRVEIARAQ